MIIRATDVNGDWTFGRGKNNYQTLNAAIGQDIGSRLSEFLGDCFFATQNGIDWFNLLGSKNQLSIQLAVRAVILNTRNVTGILALSYNLSQNRQIQISYNAQTVYGNTSQIFQYDLG